MTEQTTAVVGGGIVGLAVARELLLRRPGLRVVVFEKEDHVAAHQTGHNSGVVHAGIYYKPGSLKAQLCTHGRTLLRDYCAEHAIPYDECGKLVVAVDSGELGRLDALEKSARANDVPGLRRVEATEIREIEPHAAGLVGLHSPATAITDYVAIAESIVREIVAGGGEVRLSTPVTALARGAGGVTVTTGRAQQRFDHLVVCGGLQGDRLSQQIDGQIGPRIVPFRGEYLSVHPEKSDLVRAMIYPVPDPRYPFLGVHFTRRVTGALEIGPNAVLALAREGYRKSQVSGADLRDMATWPGFWKMARTHWRAGAGELRGSLSIRSYMRFAQRYVPEIGAADVARGGAGVRAQAVDRDGGLLDDFRLTHAAGVTCVRNAPSPAATSSLAIAEYVVDRIEEQH